MGVKTNQMEKKQTAVEWLIDSLPQIDWEHPHYAQLFNHAKQMEKEQIEVAYWEGRFDEYKVKNHYNKP